MGIEHVAIMCAFFAGFWYRGTYDRTQARIDGMEGEAMRLRKSLITRSLKPSEQSFYDEDLTQCIYDAARKKNIPIEGEKRWP